MRNPYFDPQTYVDLDQAFIERYNAKLPAERQDTHLLHAELGPQPFDGDIQNAGVVLLMSNPGWSDDYLASRDDDHSFYREGWPLSGLHPKAWAGNRTWYMQRVGLLVAEFGAQRVSQRLALLQIHPWASKKFDPASTSIPSAQLQVSLARSAIARGAIVLVGFNAVYWHRQLGLPAGTLPRGNSAMSPYLTPKNLDKHEGLWERIRAAMA